MTSDTTTPPPDHLRTRKRLRRVGVLALAIGLLLTLLGIGSFVFSFMSVARMDGEPSLPLLFPLAFVGMPLVFAGLLCLGYGYSGAISKYIVREQAPAAAEGINRVVPATLGSLQQVAAAFTRSARDEAVQCGACGQPCDVGDRFCDQCGAAITLGCPSCGQLQEADAKFCDACGASM